MGNYDAINLEKTVLDLKKKTDQVVIAAKKALKDGVDNIASDAQRRVPVRTGALKESIRIDSLEDGTVYTISADARNPKDNYPYAPIIEFKQWRTRKGKKRKRKNTAFLYPALEAQRYDLMRNIKSAMNEVISRGN